MCLQVNSLTCTIFTLFTLVTLHLVMDQQNMLLQVTCSTCCIFTYLTPEYLFWLSLLFHPADFRLPRCLTDAQIITELSCVQSNGIQLPYVADYSDLSSTAVTLTTDHCTVHTWFVAVAQHAAQWDLFYSTQFDCCCFGIWLRDWFEIYVNRGLHSIYLIWISVFREMSLSLTRGSFLAAHGPTSWPTSSMEETSSCYVYC